MHSSALMRWMFDVHVDACNEKQISFNKKKRKSLRERQEKKGETAAFWSSPKCFTKTKIFLFILFILCIYSIYLYKHTHTHTRVECALLEHKHEAGFFSRVLYWKKSVHTYKLQLDLKTYMFIYKSSVLYLSDSLNTNIISDTNATLANLQAFDKVKVFLHPQNQLFTSDEMIFRIKAPSAVPRETLSGSGGSLSLEINIIIQTI